MGVSRLRKDSNFFGTPISKVYEQAYNTTKNFSNRYVDSAHSGVFKEWQLDKLAGFVENQAVSKEMAYSSYLKAANAIDPSGNMSRMLASRLSLPTTKAQMIADAMLIVKENTSNSMGKVTSLFIRDIENIAGPSSLLAAQKETMFRLADFAGKLQPKEAIGIAADFVDNARSAVANRPGGLPLNEAMGVARGLNLNPKQMGEAFSPMVDALGMRNLGAEQFRRSWFEEIMKIHGLSKEEIAGMTGDKISLEEAKAILERPSVFKRAVGEQAILRTKPFQKLSVLGETGVSLQADLANRLMQQYPERIIERDLLYEALTDLTELNMKQNAAAATKVGTEILERGGVLRIGDIADITIPSFRQLESLSDYSMGANRGIYNELKGRYRNLFDMTKMMEEGQNIPPSVFKEHLTDLQQQVSRALGRTATGSSGFLSMPIAGSAKLTTVTADELGISLPKGAVGITERYGEKMLSGLSQIYSPQEIDALREKFLGGKGLPGVVARGQDITPVLFQRIEGSDAILALKEEVKKVGKVTEDGVKYLSNPVRFSSIGASTAPIEGELVSAILAGPQVAGKLSAAANEEAVGLMERHTIRSQFMKAAAAESGTVSVRQAMDIGLVGEGTGRQILGSLGEARAALINQAPKLSKSAVADAMDLLDWIDTASIPKEGGNNLAFASSLREGIAYREADRIAATARAALETKIAGSSAMKDGMSLVLQSIGDTETVQRTIPSLNINTASQAIADALQAQDTAYLGSVSAGRQREILHGMSAAKSAREVRQVFGGADTAKDAFSTFFSRGESFKAAVSKRAMSVANRIGTSGKSMLTHSKPVMLGLAASLALSAALAEPPQVLGPGSATPPQPNMGGSTEFIPAENIHPRSQIQGRPTAQTLERSGNTSRIATGNRVMIRGRSPGPIGYNGLSDQISQSIGGGNVRTHISDRRSSLTAQNINRLMERE